MLAWIETWLLDFKVLPQENEDESSGLGSFLLSTPGSFSFVFHCRCGRIPKSVKPFSKVTVVFVRCFYSEGGGELPWRQRLSFSPVCLAGCLSFMEQAARAPLLCAGPVSDGQFYSPPESVAGGRGGCRGNSFAWTRVLTLGLVFLDSDEEPDDKQDPGRGLIQQRS